MWVPLLLTVGGLSLGGGLLLWLWLGSEARRRAHERARFRRVFGIAPDPTTWRGTPEMIQPLRDRIRLVGLSTVVALGAPSPEGCRPPPRRPGRSSPISSRSSTVFVVDSAGEIYDVETSDDGAAAEATATWLAEALGVPLERA